jgi:hypothetical protein
MTKHRSIGTTGITIGPLLLGLILLASTAAAYQPSQQQQQRVAGNRREYLAGLLTATTAVAWTTALSAPQPANAVLGSGVCASGVGEGCGDRSDGNEYIRSLQEKSAVNKDMYERVRTVQHDVYVKRYTMPD